MKSTIALTLLMAFALSYVWPSDDYTSAALSDAIQEQRQQLRVANAERAIEKSLNRGTK